MKNINIKKSFSSIRSKKGLWSLFIFMLVSNLTVQAQQPGLLKGKVQADNENVEKIHIVNLNLEKGAITGSNGEFNILAQEDDSLYVSSVQFQNKTVLVTRRMIEEGSITIKLQSSVNELAEVVIDDIQLSGYLANDLSQISTTEVENKYKLQNRLDDFIQKDREMNPYEKPVLNGGLRLDLIAGAVMDKLAGKNKDAPKEYSPQELANKSIAIVGNEFFREDLKLKENEICNFVYFCTEDTRFKRLVINNNAFVLIEYFQTKIEDFRERRGAILNNPVQLPS
ncbi:carboxypeptidase-like regulatory domain-containing protein [Christiangramia aestuarii]|uniref:Carboxypeptidase-like regulatory domain-containing protein n=1 Tax=Christiangramia aestuarii TaxID=1028746 RepID=A0A7M3SY86_9FLAO|nr:carboxypeptidase-like regulatory domain-containing protein [Christiangramia aestuarii]MUP41567.1 hypothetical protein [Christiangramia aestuarii]